MGDMLDSVAAKLPESNMSPMISYLSFDAERGQLPGWSSLDEFDAVLITGSSKNQPFNTVGNSRRLIKVFIGYSAFDSQPWIRKLGSFIEGAYTLLLNSSKNFLTNNLAIYKDKPNIRLLGSCFGHQLICHSLFKVRISSETIAIAQLLSASNAYSYRKRILLSQPTPRYPIPYLFIPSFPETRKGGNSEYTLSSFPRRSWHDSAQSHRIPTASQQLDFA